MLQPSSGSHSEYVFKDLAVGVVVALFQAVTQLQEMTIVFVPKIIAVFFMIALLGGWMLEKLVAYGTLCFTSIEDVAD